MYRDRFKRRNSSQQITDKQSSKRAVAYDSHVSEGVKVK